MSTCDGGDNLSVTSEAGWWASVVSQWQDSRVSTTTAALDTIIVLPLHPIDIVWPVMRPEMRTRSCTRTENKTRWQLLGPTPGPCACEWGYGHTDARHNTGKWDNRARPCREERGEGGQWGYPIHGLAQYKISCPIYILEKSMCYGPYLIKICCKVGNSIYGVNLAWSLRMMDWGMVAACPQCMCWHKVPASNTFLLQKLLF